MESLVVYSTVYARWIVSVYNFSYTGNYQTFKAPANGTYKIELWGASAQQYYFDTSSYSIKDHQANGNGGYVSGDISLSESINLYIYVGQKGYGNSDYSDGNQTTKSYSKSFNGGGGNSGTYGNMIIGGGATDIRIISGSWNDASSLRSRIMVAGGGGGVINGYTDADCSGYYYTSSNYNYYSNAGGLSGYSYPTNSACANKSGASGGSQVNGGSAYPSTTSSGIMAENGGFGYGGDGVGRNAYGAGGGGGWYGGGGGGDSLYGGGGGSSYISGHTGAVAITSTSSSTPKSGCTTGTTNNVCSISPYGYSFINTIMIDGSGYAWTNTKGSLSQMPSISSGLKYASGAGHIGNGYARITILSVD